MKEILTTSIVGFTAFNLSSEIYMRVPREMYTIPPRNI